MEIAAWCPSCAQKYSVSEAHLDKQFRCKKCNQLFGVRDATQEPRQTSQAKPSGVQPNVGPNLTSTVASQSSLGHAVEPIEIVEASVVEDTFSQAAVVEPEGVGQVFDDYSSFSARPASKSYPYNDTYSNPSSARHVPNPRMVPAVLAAVIIPLILGGICFGINAVRTFRSVAQQVNAQRDRVAAAPDIDMAEVAPTDFKMSKRKDRESDPIDVHQDKRPPGKQFAPPNFVPSNLSSAERAEAVKSKIAEARAESERRSAKFKADREARSREREARSKARKAKYEKNKQERAQRDIARAETRRFDEEAKAYMDKVESEADRNPMDGMIARIPINSWGVKKMAISNDGLVYAVTPDKFLVYDCETQQDVSRQDELKSIDGFNTLCLSDDGTMLAVGGDRGGIEVQKVSGRGKLKSIGSFAEGSKTVKHLAFNSDQTRLMSFDRSMAFCIWDIPKKAKLKTEHFESDLLTFSKNSEQNTITLATSKKWTTFGFENGEELESGSFPFNLNRDSIYSPDGSRILDKSGSGVIVRKLDEKEALCRLKSEGVQWTIANVNEHEFVVGGNRHIYQFNWKTKKLLKVWSLPEAAYVQKIAMSPDGSLMAASYGSTSQDIFVFKLDGN